MAATLSATGGAGKVTLTGSGYVGSTCVLTVAFSAANRRYNEMRAIPVSGGSVSVDVTVPFAGSVTVKAIDLATWATLATTSSVNAT